MYKGHAESQLSLSLLLMKSGDKKSGLVMLRRAANQNLPAAMRFLGQALYEEQEVDQALTWLMNAVTTAKKQGLYHEVLHSGSVAARVHLEIAENKDPKGGIFSKALDFFQRVQSLPADHVRESLLHRSQAVRWVCPRVVCSFIPAWFYM